MLRELLEATPDPTTEELRIALTARGHGFGYGTRHRSFRRHGLTRKKTGHTGEQDGPDILKCWQAWFDGQFDLDPEWLVVIDATWAKTNMTRTHGCCPRRRVPAHGCPHGALEDDHLRIDLPIEDAFTKLEALAAQGGWMHSVRTGQGRQPMRHRHMPMNKTMAPEPNSRPPVSSWLAPSSDDGASRPGRRCAWSRVERQSRTTVILA